MSLIHAFAGDLFAPFGKYKSKTKGVRFAHSGQENLKSKARGFRPMGRRKYFVRCEPPKPRGRPRKTAEEKRARKTETQRYRREGERMAGEFVTDAI